jgi:hypothetical protein
MTKQKKRKKDTDRPKIGHRPRKWTDLELFQERVNQYFAECDAKNETYTVTGLAMALNLARENLLRYEDERPGYSEVVKKAREKIQKGIEAAIIEGGKAGKNVVGLIFWLKNNAAWSDEFRLAGSGGEPLALEMSSLEVAARIATIFALAKKRKEEQAVELVPKELPEKV